MADAVAGQLRVDVSWDEKCNFQDVRQDPLNVQTNLRPFLKALKTMPALQGESELFIGMGKFGSFSHFSS